MFIDMNLKVEIRDDLYPEFLEDVESEIKCMRIRSSIWKKCDDDKLRPIALGIIMGKVMNSQYGWQRYIEFRQAEIFKESDSE
jgi:hypothetical protein